jgi:cell division protein FtsQ
MSARVRRTGSPRTKARKPAARAAKTVARKLTVDRARANTLAGLAFCGFMLAIAAVVLVALDVPAKAMNAAGEAVGEAGFRVRGYEINGLDNMARAPIDAVVAEEVGRAQPMVDVDGIRERLLHYGWVKDARVSRRLPDTLVIDIVERKPAALWQDREQLALIDQEGVVLDRVRIDQMPDLPLLIGAGANVRAEQLDRLISAVPTLKPQLASARWVGLRRWDLNFQSGETLLLPEGDAAAKTALTKFAEMDKTAGLLGRGVLRYDLRIEGKMIARLPRPAAEFAVPSPAAPQG